MKSNKTQQSRTARFLALAARNVLSGLLLLVTTGIFCITDADAATALNQPLDSANPVYFYGDTISYKGETIALDANNIYIDGTLSDELCSQYNYVYNDFKKAYTSGGMKSGTESAPMNVWMAPYVYWIDDPDDPAIREGINGNDTPYGLLMDISYLSMNGLTDKPENVVLAVNRGHNAGAKGNFTMLHINGTGTHTENLTMGNYCCVDLNFPLNPELSRQKRQEAITQSQLVLTNGSKITAQNCNFISRLNSCPFSGGSRILFQDCHFECTDDSLANSAIYLRCDFDFYSSKPFYNTSGTGSVMLDCKFHIMHSSDQFLTKAGGVVAIIDSTFYCKKEDQYIGWTPNPSTSLRCVEGNVTVQYDYTDANGVAQQKIVTDYKMDANAPYDNVNITDTAAMDAYRFTYNGETIYNVYGLFRGTDDWDPLKQKELIAAAGTAAGKDYLDVPVSIACDSRLLSIETETSKDITVSYRAFSTETTKTDTITWSVEDVLKDYITIKEGSNGTCTITCKNDTLIVKKGMVYAKASSGLTSGVYVTATPKTQPAPTFVSNPVLAMTGDGSLELRYTLSNDGILDDYSSITWYRCNDAAGKSSIPVAVSRAEAPLRTYRLSYGDVGYYLKAVITPKQLCTASGDSVTALFPKPITLEDVKASPFLLETDFSDFSSTTQTQILEGFWTKDVYKAWLTDGSEKNTNDNAWKYALGEVGYGSEGLYGLLPTNRGARLMYTPTAGTYGDMSLKLVVNPEKNAGQGFGSAGQYMDIFIKYDTSTLTGYALRIERISTLDCGVQAALVEYKNDTVTYISDRVTTSAFNAECTIAVAVKSGTLSASITTTHSQSEKQINANLQHSVSLEAKIDGNTFGGTGLITTGTFPAGNRVMLNQLSVSWDEATTTLQAPTAVDISDTIDLSDVTCTGIPSVVGYTGKPHTPTITLTYNGTTLVRDTDYTVTYQNNVNVGRATVMIKGLGKYSGELTKTFQIEIPNSAQPAPKKGTKFTAGGLNYKITNAAANGKGTVILTGSKKKSIKTVKIPAAVICQKVSYKVTAIDKKAFSGCKKLKSATVGKNVTSIGAQAFNGCRALKKITVSSKSLKKVGKNALKGIHKKCVIKVPASKAANYKKLFKGKGQAKSVKVKK